MPSADEVVKIVINLLRIFFAFIAGLALIFDLFLIPFIPQV